MSDTLWTVTGRIAVYGDSAVVVALSSKNRLAPIPPEAVTAEDREWLHDQIDSLAAAMARRITQRCLELEAPMGCA